jgi:zinc protease
MITIVNSQELDRTKRPIGKSAPVVTLPQIQKSRLSSGLEVWLVERHQLPLVAFNLVLYAGSDQDPIGQPGIASMTADLLDEGTKTRDALQISEEMESIGAQFGVGSSWDGSFLTLNCLSKYMEKALGVFSDVLLNPVFPQKEFDRLQKQRITSLIQQKDQATAIASNAYFRIIYGANHPSGANPSGTETSLKNMTVSDLQKFYQTFFKPNNATLIIVGDTKMSDVVPILEKTLGAWQKGDVTISAVPEPAILEKSNIYIIDKPGAPQSEIRIGCPALARSTTDFFAVSVMNQMLGGQFMSRINLNLREKRGFTYGARSGFSFLKGKGPFTASSGVHSAKTDSSVQEFLYEINLMHDKGITQEELEFVKKSLIGNFALNFETSRQIAGALQSLILYGLPEKYFDNYIQNIEAVTTEDIQRVSSKYLDTSKMAIVVVGDVATIKRGLEALGVGNIVVCDVDGIPIK